MSWPPNYLLVDALPTTMARNTRWSHSQIIFLMLKAVSQVIRKVAHGGHELCISRLNECWRLTATAAAVSTTLAGRSSIIETTATGILMGFHLTICRKRVDFDFHHVSDEKTHTSNVRAFDGFYSFPDHSFDYSQRYDDERPWDNSVNIVGPWFCHYCSRVVVLQKTFSPAFRRYRHWYTRHRAWQNGFDDFSD